MLDEIFWEIHSGLPREGPGDNQSTRRAYMMMARLASSPRILDVACGPGMQTIELAGISSGHITAVDKHQLFLDELNRRAASAGLLDKISTINASMFEMPFEENEFDIIWCEGAMYIMGVSRALASWEKFLVPGGYIAFTEPCFLIDPLPEVRDFWQQDYSDMTDISKTIQRIHSAGYTLIDHFTIPDSSWWTDYYNPQLIRLQTLCEKYCDNPDVLRRLDDIKKEIDMHRKYSKFYGYVFFVAENA